MENATALDGSVLVFGEVKDYRQILVGVAPFALPWDLPFDIFEHYAVPCR